MVMDPTLPRIKVRDLLMQAFLTGWERSDKSTSQDEYLQSSIQVIEMLQVEPENLYAEEGLGLPDGSTLLDKDCFIYGGALTLELETYLTDRVALLLSARERALFGSDIGKFHTQVSVGLKFIIN